MFHTFEEIEAWKEGRELTNFCRPFLKRARQAHDYNWADQLSSALLSITANIAEGNDAKTNAEFAAFLSYSKRSAAESRSHFYYGLDSEFIKPEEHAEASKRAKKIGAQLAKLISYLCQAPDKGMRMGKYKEPVNELTS